MAIKISGTTVIDDDRKETNLRYNTSVVSANTTATSGTFYYLDGDITLTLPSTPTAGDKVGVSNFGASNQAAAIARNGNNIMGIAEDLQLDLQYAAFILTYVDATNGWVFT